MPSCSSKLHPESGDTVVRQTKHCLHERTDQKALRRCSTLRMDLTGRQDLEEGLDASSLQKPPSGLQSSISW
jgi:hypothetical protein